MGCFRFLLFVAALVACPVLPPAQNAKAQKIQQYMLAANKLQGFSGSILVARNGEVLSSGGYGMANAEWNNPNRPSTKFRIGSLTKQFTAMAVMILQEHKALSVTDPICKYVRNCPASWRAISIHELLTHTSGIPDYTEFPKYEETQALPTSVGGLIDRFCTLPLRFTPGDKFEYTNSGYVLLGAIIEKAAGKPYPQFLQEAIFRPLGMHNTGYDNNRLVLAERASGYTKDGSEIKNATYIDMSVPFAAGGLYSTVGDLLLWDQALYTERLMSHQSLEAMFTPYMDMVGYGWAVSPLFNRKMFHHNGSIDGFVSNIARFPADKVLIVVLSNFEQAPVDVITKDLAAIVFGESYELPKAKNIVKLESSLYDSCVGRYQITADLVLTVTRKGDHLFGQLSGQSQEQFELLPQSPTKWFSKEPPVDIVFGKGGDGMINSLNLNGQYTGKKIN